MFHTPMSACSESWVVRNLRSNITTLERWSKRLSDYRTRSNTGFLVTGFLVVTEEVIRRRHSSILLNLILLYLKSPFRGGIRLKDAYNDYAFSFIWPSAWEGMTIKAWNYFAFVFNVVPFYGAALVWWRSTFPCRCCWLRTTKKANNSIYVNVT
jgi:hypothetical protein